MKRVLVAASFSLAACAAPDSPEPRTPTGGARTLDSTLEGFTRNPIPSGFLLGMPAGVTADSSVAIRIKTAGLTTLLPGNPGARPNFSDVVRAVFANLQPMPAESPFAAMSIGVDIINIAPDDVQLTRQVDGLPPGGYPLLTIGDHGWSAVQFTVNTAELTPDDLLAPHVDVSAGRDRAVFSFPIPESYENRYPGLFLLNFEKTTVRALDPDHLGLVDPNDAIHALDMHMALYHTDLPDHGGVFTTRPLPPHPTVFFALRQVFLSAATPEAVRVALGLATAPDARTIYAVTWNGSAWGAVSPYRTLTQIGITNANAHIDGLALDAKNTPAPEDDDLLLSLTPTGEYAAPARQVIHKGPNRDPRPVLIRKQDRHVSLGRTMGSGAAIGDFCTGDPILDPAPYRLEKVKRVVDDYAIARRLPPGTAATNIDLSIALFRAWNGTAPIARACMARSVTTASGGTATVEYAELTDLTAPGNPNWRLHSTFDYEGRPFAVDLPLPARIPEPQAANAAANVVANPLRAFAVRWRLDVDGTTSISPIAALRY